MHLSTTNNHTPFSLSLCLPSIFLCYPVPPQVPWNHRSKLHQQHNHHASHQRQQHCSCNSRQVSPQIEEYYLCECNSCRNLGNSVDVCCQCCACADAAAEEAAEQATAAAAAASAGTSSSSRRYQVASMALTGDTDDTLEVRVLQIHNLGLRSFSDHFSTQQCNIFSVRGCVNQIFWLQMVTAMSFTEPHREKYM